MYILAAYLLGSIPFGLLIARIWNIDIRQYGSGNIGATNVFRTLGPLPGTIVFTLDLLKGTLAIYLATYFTQDPLWIVAAATAVILGHIYPIFLKFKGGKGAATGLGVLLGVAPDIFAGAIIMVGLFIFLTRYVSVASLAVPILVAIAFMVLKRPLPYVVAAWIVAILIIIRHLPNIQRLIKGEELKI